MESLELNQEKRPMYEEGKGSRPGTKAALNHSFMLCELPVASKMKGTLIYLLIGIINNFAISKHANLHSFTFSSQYPW